MKNENLIDVCIYCDSTGLFNASECAKNNLTDMQFPVWIVEEWYKTNEADCIAECEEEKVTPCFKNWYNEAYTAHSTDGLYDFAVSKGYDPVFGHGIDNLRNAVCYDNERGQTVVLFKGSYLECRKWAREYEWEHLYYFDSIICQTTLKRKAELKLLFV